MTKPGLYHRNFIFILFTVFSLNVFSQILSPDFQGELKYENKWKYALVRYGKCKKYTIDRTLVKADQFIIARDTSSSDQSDTKRYLAFKFLKEKDYIRLIYFNPIKSIYDTVNQFPLKVNDTIESYDDYLLKVDSIYEYNVIEKEWYFRNCKISSDYSETTYIGDSAIKVLGHIYDCFRFEKFNYGIKSNPGPSHYRIIIYIDKNSLLPLREEQYSWYMHHPCFKTKEWVLTRTLELKSIKYQ